MVDRPEAYRANVVVSSVRKEEVDNVIMIYQQSNRAVLPLYVVEEVVELPKLRR
jgi:hypothetical protein